MNAEILAQAKTRAKNEDQAFAVIRIDEGLTTRLKVVREDYVDEPEFQAFDGKIIFIVYPNGSIE